MNEKERNSFDVYKTFCNNRFKSIENKLDEVYTSVNDGLKDDMKEVKSKTNWLVGIMVGLLVSIVLMAVGLWFQSKAQFYELENKIEIHMRDTADDK